MDVDEVYKRYAEFGFYQQQVFAFLAVFQAFLALHQVQNVFVGKSNSWPYKYILFWKKARHLNSNFRKLSKSRD